MHRKVRGVDDSSPNREKQLLCLYDKLDSITLDGFDVLQLVTLSEKRSAEECNKSRYTYTSLHSSRIFIVDLTLAYKLAYETAVKLGVSIFICFNIKSWCSRLDTVNL